MLPSSGNPAMKILPDHSGSFPVDGKLSRLTGDPTWLSSRKTSIRWLRFKMARVWWSGEEVGERRSGGTLKVDTGEERVRWMRM